METSAACAVLERRVTMNFTAYIERQKAIIRNRHEGETFLLQRGEVINVSENENLFAELSKSRGLNTKERISARRAAKAV
ncbi:MAG: hypothetical protein K2L42_06720 [Clostridia bacterium]|nr:hypothetical protein [Clostridia bacterium]